LDPERLLGALAWKSCSAQRGGLRGADFARLHIDLPTLLARLQRKRRGGGLAGWTQMSLLNPENQLCGMNPFAWRRTNEVRRQPHDRQHLNVSVGAIMLSAGKSSGIKATHVPSCRTRCVRPDAA
jgi:hypothetical protein